MRKYVFVTVSCCLFAGGLCADPVDYTINDLTATLVGGGPRVNINGSGFSASGDAITIGGSYGTARVGGPIFPGDHVGPDASIGLSCGGLPNCIEGGIASVGGKQFDVELIPVSIPQISPNSNAIFQPPTLTYILPATATGEFTAVCMFSPNCVDGTLIGNVFIDLTGDVTVNYEAVSLDTFLFESASFVSAPEPSGIGLNLIGVGIVAAALRRRRLETGDRQRISASRFSSFVRRLNVRKFEVSPHFPNSDYPVQRDIPGASRPN